MIRRGLAGAALAVVIMVSGCGSSAVSQRLLVARYVQQANSIESQFAAPLQSVTKAAGSFAAGTGHKAKGLAALSSPEQSLVNARATLTTLTHRLTLLAPPPPARHLQVLLVAMAKRQTALTDEMAKLVRFLPAFSAGLKPLGLATRQLQSSLSSTQAYGYGQAGVNVALTVKAQALDRYRTTVNNVIRYMRHLDPPPVSMPQYRTQVHTLRALSSSARALAASLRNGQTNLGPLLARFDRAAVGTQTRAAQRAEANAIRAYDHTVGSLQSLSHEIAVERARLSTTLK